MSEHQPPHLDSQALTLYEVLLLFKSQVWVFVCTFLVLMALASGYVVKKYYMGGKAGSSFSQLVQLAGYYGGDGSQQSQQSQNVVESFHTIQPATILLREMNDGALQQKLDVAFAATNKDQINNTLLPEGLIQLQIRAVDIYRARKKMALLVEQVRRLQSQAVDRFRSVMERRMGLAKERFNTLTSTTSGKNIRAQQRFIAGVLAVAGAKQDVMVLSNIVSSVEAAHLVGSLQQRQQPPLLKYWLLAIFSSIFIALVLAFLVGVVRQQAMDYHSNKGK